MKMALEKLIYKFVCIQIADWFAGQKPSVILTLVSILLFPSVSDMKNAKPETHVANFRLVL